MFPGFDLFPVCERCQTQMSFALNLEMSVEMFYAADKALAFRHIRTGPESDGITSFALLYGRMWFMSITPRRYPVYK